MCIGRSKNLEPCCSAILFNLGPTSIVTNVMMPAATRATSMASARRMGCFRFRFDFGTDADTLTAGGWIGPDAGTLTAGGWIGPDAGTLTAGGAAAGCGGGSRDSSVNDHKHAAGLDRGAGRHRHVLHAPGLGRAQLVLHLHRLDDDDRLARLHPVADSDQHADDAPGHRREDSLITVRGGAAVRRDPSRAPAVDGDRDAEP